MTTKNFLLDGRLISVPIFDFHNFLFKIFFKSQIFNNLQDVPSDDILAGDPTPPYLYKSCLPNVLDPTILDDECNPLGDICLECADNYFNHIINTTHYSCHAQTCPHGTVKRDQEWYHNMLYQLRSPGAVKVFFRKEFQFRSILT